MKDDLRMALDFPRHFKTRKLRRLLGADAVLSLLSLWAYAATNRTKGFLHDMSVQDIAIAAEWEGDPQTFMDALLECRWMEMVGDIHALHDWEVHQPWVFGKDDRSHSARLAGKASGKTRGKKQRRSAKSNGTRTEYERNTNGTRTEYERNTNGTRTEREPLSVSVSVTNKKEKTATPLRGEGARTARVAGTLPLGPGLARSQPDPEYPELDTDNKRMGFLLSRFGGHHLARQRRDWFRACSAATTSGLSPPEEPREWTPNWGRDRGLLRPLLARGVGHVEDEMAVYHATDQSPGGVRAFCEWFAAREKSQEPENTPTELVTGSRPGRGGES